MSDVPNNADSIQRQVDEVLVRQLTTIADTLTSMVARLSDHHSTQINNIEVFKEELRAAREGIRSIVKVLHEGNGERPLLSRVAVLETQMLNLVEDITVLYEHEERRRALEAESKTANTTGKYALTGAVISGILALATAIISLLLN